jgi:rod shape determining protein RodA
MSKRQSYFVQSDFLFLFFLFVCISLVAIYNAQQLEQYIGENFVVKQIIWFTVGALVVAAMQFFDLDQLYKISIYTYIFGVFILVLLFISPDAFANTVNGAKRGFTLPGLSLQPSEFTKITTILYLSAVISKHKEKFKVSTLKSDWLLLGKMAGIIALPLVFILRQPDLGTSIVFMFVAGVLVILAGIDWKLIVTIVVGGVLLAAVAIGLVLKFPQAAEAVGIKAYQAERVVTWFDPTQQTTDDTFQVDRSKLAVGSGQLMGKGISGLQVKLPEAHTDFVFSVIGESFGFIGSAVVIFVYFLLLYKLVTLGLKVFQYSDFGAYICFGFMSVLLIHAFQNIGMTIGIMPVTGIPLLLISYGGSSVLSTMIGLGLVYRVAVEYSIQNDYLFK